MSKVCCASKNEVLSLDPQHPHEGRLVWCCRPATTGKEVDRGCWTAGVAETLSSNLRRRAGPKTEERD